MKTKRKPLPGIVAPTDLTSITRPGARTVVALFDGYERREWLVLGIADLAMRNSGRPEFGWLLKAYLTSGVTDFEHDSAYALMLPLIGVAFDAVRYSVSAFSAWVHPDADDGFHVPRPGYNPMKHKEAYTCKDGPCKKEPHVIVPEGFYAPPFDAELYAAVKGQRVEIGVGPKERRT